jgi:Flp pilus assembly pilin Flp
MIRWIKRLATDRRGGISVEYALPAGLIGVAAALACVALGDALDQAYEPGVVVTTQARSVPSELGL